MHINSFFLVEHCECIQIKCLWMLTSINYTYTGYTYTRSNVKAKTITALIHVFMQGLNCLPVKRGEIPYDKLLILSKGVK